MMGPHITLAQYYKIAGKLILQIIWAASQVPWNLGAEDLHLGLTLVHAITFWPAVFSSVK